MSKRRTRKPRKAPRTGKNERLCDTLGSSIPPRDYRKLQADEPSVEKAQLTKALR